MYLRQPLDTATAAYNRSAALWVAMFAFMLMPSETACSVWCQERAVVSFACLLFPLPCLMMGQLLALALHACPRPLLKCKGDFSWVVCVTLL